MQKDAQLAAVENRAAQNDRYLRESPAQAARPHTTSPDPTPVPDRKDATTSPDIIGLHQHIQQAVDSEMLMRRRCKEEEKFAANTEREAQRDRARANDLETSLNEQVRTNV